MHKLFFFFLLFILLTSSVFAQNKQCNEPCTYQQCDSDSDCPICKAVDGAPVGPNGQGTCQPYYNAPEMSSIAFYGIIVVFGVVFSIFIRKRLRNFVS
jgi:hypothetical protein